MGLVLLIGGARSGKSALAVRIAQAQNAPVTFVATAEAGDDEMASRIDAHKRERPASWATVEEPLELAQALNAIEPGACVIVDCLTLWATNALAKFGAADAFDRALHAARIAGDRPGQTVAITNEVGLGLVPDYPLGREFRDLLGRINAVWAQASERAFMLVAGRALPLPSDDDVIGALR